RLLPHLDALLRIERDLHDPVAIAEAALLRQREDDLVLQRIRFHARVKSPQVGRVLLRLLLAEPEDRLLTKLLVFGLAFDEVAQDLGGAWRALLGEREYRLVLDLLVCRVLEEILEERDGSIRMHLTEPEDRLLTRLLIRIVLGGLHQDVGRLFPPLLRDEE